MKGVTYPGGMRGFGLEEANETRKVSRRGSRLSIVRVLIEGCKSIRRETEALASKLNQSEE